MPPTSRGLSVSRARRELTICLQCRFRLERHLSTSILPNSRLPSLPNPNPLRSRTRNVRLQGAYGSRRLVDTQNYHVRLYHSSPQLPVDQIGLEPLFNRDARCKRNENLAAKHFTRKFATHADSQSSKLDDVSELLHQALRREKVDIKSRLRSWQQEYDKSDEAALPYVAHFGDSATIRAKANRNVNVVQNLKDQIVQEEDDDQGLGYSRDLEPLPSFTTLKMPGAEAGFLQKGDLVELSQKGGSVLSVFLRAIGQEHEFLTINGILTHQVLSNIYLSLSPFIDPELLQPLLDQLPPRMSDGDDVDTWAPRESSAPLLKALLDFDRDAKEFYQQHAAKLDNIHDELASEKEFRYMKTREIAGYVVNQDPSKVRDHELLAVHRALMKVPIGFRINKRYHRFTHSMEILPKRVVRSFTKVVVWLRDLQEASIAQAHQRKSSGLPFQVKYNPVGPFLEKARKRIAASRSNRASSKVGRLGSYSYDKTQQPGGDRPAMGIDSCQEFTYDEAHLVRFIRFWAVEPHVSSPHARTLEALGSQLVRATGCYDDFEVTRMTGFTFLQEIGSVLPWDTRTGYDYRLRLKDHHPGLKIDRLWRAATDEAKSWRAEEPVDTMKDLRKDWGPLEVFSIDPEISTVIDDGFSIEDIQDEPGIYWLHMHTANPTCYVQPDSAIALHAKEMLTSTLLPDRSHHMINPSTIRDFFCLAPNQRVLTFSAKMDLQGNMLDKAIRPGIIRNCIRLNKIAVQDALYPGSMADAAWRTHAVGCDPETGHETRQQKKVYQPLNEDQLDKLRLIQKLSLARARTRPHWDIMQFRQSAPLVTASFPKEIYESFRPRDNPVVTYRTAGDPLIRLYATPFNPTASPEKLLEFDRIVEDAMILACEVAALWCKERNIPSLYRGTIRNTEVITPQEFQEQVVKPAIERTGKPPFMLIQNYGRLVTRSMFSSKPIPHEGLGMEGYLRVTSPLRRYAEMVAHWQIESALRYEHATGKSLVGCENPEPHLVFTREEIESLFVRLLETEVITGFATRNTHLSWISMFFFRAHYHGEGNLPPTLKVFITHVDTRKRRIGTLEMLNTDVRVVESEVSNAEGGLQIGDWWECKIATVDTYLNKIDMDPVRLVKRIGHELCLDLQSRIEVRKD